MDWSRLDTVPKEFRPRQIFVTIVEAEDKKRLKRKGYLPTSILILPRRTEAEQQHYLSCMLQGIAEGTLEASKEQLRAIELDMKNHGMLNQTQTKVNVYAELNESTADLLSWGRSRHTLTENTNIKEIPDLKEK